MNTDFTIYKTQWGCTADDEKWVCESNQDGMIYSAHNTYQSAVEWCRKKGYSHN